MAPLLVGGSSLHPGPGTMMLAVLRSRLDSRCLESQCLKPGPRCLEPSPRCLEPSPRCLEPGPRSLKPSLWYLKQSPPAPQPPLAPTHRRAWALPSRPRWRAWGWSWLTAAMWRWVTDVATSQSEDSFLPWSTSERRVTKWSFSCPEKGLPGPLQKIKLSSMTSIKEEFFPGYKIVLTMTCLSSDMLTKRKESSSPMTSTETCSGPIQSWKIKSRTERFSSPGSKTPWWSRRTPLDQMAQACTISFTFKHLFIYQ